MPSSTLPAALAMDAVISTILALAVLARRMLPPLWHICAVLVGAMVSRLVANDAIKSATTRANSQAGFHAFA